MMGRWCTEVYSPSSTVVMALTFLDDHIVWEETNLCFNTYSVLLVQGTGLLVLLRMQRLSSHSEVRVSLSIDTRVSDDFSRMKKMKV